MRLLLGALLCVFLGACSSQGAEPAARSTPTQNPTQSPSAPVAPAATDACAEVRAGIDAFNQGDFNTTVKHFEQALPLAEKNAAKVGTREADQLVEAVKYYAELTPSAYAESSRTSSEFEKYKQITLRQCSSDSGSPSTEGPDLTA